MGKRWPFGSDIQDALVDVAKLDELREDTFRGTRYRHHARIDAKLRRERFFVRIADSGKAEDFTRQRLRVQPLHVVFDAFLERSGDVNLQEVADPGPRLVARGTVRADRRDKDRDVVARKQAGYESNASDVPVAVHTRKAEFRGDVCAHDIPVENLDLPSVRAQPRRHGLRQGRLAGSGQTREPDYDATFASLHDLPSASVDSSKKRGGAPEGVAGGRD
jgi:hypothetical protein